MLRRLFFTGWLALAPMVALAETITVFAAASLGDALSEVAEAFEAETGHDVVVSAAGSSVLARQIQQGAPADLFISANPDWVDVLQDAGDSVAGTRVALLGNRLVLIGPVTDAAPVALTPAYDLPARLADGRLAMALMQAVPAGIYGAEALAHLGWLDALRPRIAQVDNVRAALALVALGEARFGITYATDARAEPRVSVVGLFPPESHAPITYPMVLIRETPQARALHRFLQTPSAAAVFAAHGFAVLAR
ncbi:molybdate ABC transporter substrate-binding protein [Cognatishimia sp. F0-27]|uniref:molybdate ABC transporter substrate-binding protein n=1 Tax=Cognatishimia sp. F0-27 TaxID=2816855 RepID=UPI001D0C4161|nr:molybdate ABC transporter substrate-binding protein [Cognatishimia sp. F0-27]MCC1491140.1 molybdate ABC transporter substrate-binding protein [Cognatishimia sp. F0-27]